MDIIKPPIIFIVGPTACGKSKLAVDIATSLSNKCEIINADTMQMYQGLPIATNKISTIEQEGIKHHLIDFLDPFSNIYNVQEFQEKAHNIIKDLTPNKTIPIIVGGTNYYIEALLWNYLIRKNANTNMTPLEPHILFDQFKEDVETILLSHDAKEHTNMYDPYNVLMGKSVQGIPTPILYNLLFKHDYQQSLYIHPLERRKIIRYLQIYLQTKQQPSNVIKNQKYEANPSSSITPNIDKNISGSLNYHNAVMFYISAEPTLLQKIIDERVDSMIDKGLLTELINFYESVLLSHPLKEAALGTNKGIFQNIGFKEFRQLIELKLNPNTNNSLNVEKQLVKCTKALKLSTYKYAKRQIKFINSRFIQRRQLTDRPFIYKFDLLTDHFTDRELWLNDIVQPAKNILLAHMKYGYDKTKLSMFLKENNECCKKHFVYTAPSPNTNVMESAKVFECPICTKYMIGPKSYQSHLQSKGHKAAIKNEKAIQCSS